jgi:polyhydroxybutyrate depolymerase
LGHGVIRQRQARIGRAALVVAAIIVAAALPSGASARPQAPAPTPGTIVVGGVTRTYTLVQPVAPAGRRVPLLIVLEGAFSSGPQTEAMTGFDAIAERRQFDVAYPEPLAGIWHLGCCDAVRKSRDDVVFISRLISRLTADASVDPTRVYVAGFSIGAALAYRLACELSPQVAGIGSVGGFQYLSNPCHPKRPVSVIEIHGTNDYYGGSCGGQTQTNKGCSFGQPGYEPSVLELNAQWRKLDSCPSHTASRVRGGLSSLTASRCGHGTGVRVYTIQGGGHCWPAVGATDCLSFDASLAIWSFLSAHHRTGAR